MKMLAMSQIKYISYSVLFGLVISHSVSAESNDQHNAMQQEKAYLAQQNKLRMLDEAQDKKQLISLAAEKEESQLESLRQEENAHLAAMKEEAEQNSDLQQQPEIIEDESEIRAALDKELEQYNKNLKNQSSY